MTMKKMIRYNEYDPSVSIRENAFKMGCSVPTVKKFLRRTGTDKKYDSYYVKWKAVHDLDKAHPEYSLRKRSEILGYSVNTIRKYKTMSEKDLAVSFRDTEKVSSFDIRNNNAVRSVSDSQPEILRWIISLYNDGKTFDADLTASLLKFYKKIPVPANLFDKFPQLPCVRNLDEADVLPDSSFGSVIYDLPFIISSGSPSDIKERFSTFASEEELYAANDEMLRRSYRLLKHGGLLVVKTMDASYQDRQLWVSDYVLRRADSMGLELLDKFILVSHWRIFGRTRQQHRARKYHSYFFVFRKG